MTSPYSTSLLQEPVRADERERTTSEYPRPHAGRSVTHVTHQPAPVAWQPQPQQQPVTYVLPAPRTSRLSAALLAVVVVLVGAVALVGAYVATRSAAPSADEARFVSSIALQEGYTAGRQRGVGLGRETVLANVGTTARLRASIARENAYAAAFRSGRSAGASSYRAPRSYGYGGGFRNPGFSYGSGNGFAVAGALGQAQSLANATGAPVDVTIY